MCCNIVFDRLVKFTGEKKARYDTIFGQFKKKEPRICFARLPALRSITPMSSPSKPSKIPSFRCVPTSKPRAEGTQVTWWGFFFPTPPIQTREFNQLPTPTLKTPTTSLPAVQADPGVFKAPLRARQLRGPHPGSLSSLLPRRDLHRRRYKSATSRPANSLSSPPSIPHSVCPPPPSDPSSVTTAVLFLFCFLAVIIFRCSAL